MSSDKPSIWVLEDDAGSRFVYSEILGGSYRLSFSTSIVEFKQRLDTLGKERLHLMIADLKLSDGSFLNYLSSSHSLQSFPFPFMVVSSLDDIDSLRFCFQRGAVDYLTKPFARAELQVKVEKALSLDLRGAILDFSDVKLDVVTLTILRGQRRSPLLTSKEFRIVALLMNTENQTLPRQDLISEVWGGMVVSPKAFDVHLSNLRKKLARISLGVAYLPPHAYRLIRE